MAVPAGAYDWGIDGLLFNAAVTVQSPYERAFSRVLKDQVDNSSEPGDQSLEGWWVRSQTDWSAGAGYEFMEPISADPIPKTFNWSFGVNPWTPGEIYLHHASTPGGAAASVDAATMTYLNGRIYFSVGAEVYSTPYDDPSTVTAVATLPSAVTTLTGAFGHLIAGTTANGVWDVVSGGASSKIYNTTNPTKVWFVKDRLVFSDGPSLYAEAALPHAGGGGHATTHTPVIKETDPNFKWHDAAAGPKGIYLAGESNGRGGIYLLTIGSDGGIPTLDAPVSVAELPTPEVCQALDIYLGTYLMMRTTAGVRVGMISDSGNITYGPLLGCGTLTGGFAFYDHFAYGCVKDAGEGRSGLIRFDLSGVTDEQKVPWALDVRVPVGDAHTVKNVLVFGKDELVFLGQDTTETRLFSSHASSAFEEYGVLQSGWIRMNTTVRKTWASMGLTRSVNSVGRVTGYLVTDDGVAHEVGSLTTPDFKKTFSIAGLDLTTPRAAVRIMLHGVDTPPITPPPVTPPVPGDPDFPTEPPGANDRTWADLKAFGTWQKLVDDAATWLTFKPAGAHRTHRAVKVQEKTTPGMMSIPTGTTDLEAWSLRATPAVDRTELLRIPLLCFDFELDNSGQRVGGVGTAITRYEELVAAVRDGGLVAVTDYNNDRVYSVSVEDMSFKQVAAPDRGEGFGGVIDFTGKVIQ